jgi:hypothetical protein
MLADRSAISIANSETGHHAPQTDCFDHPHQPKEQCEGESKNPLMSASNTHWSFRLGDARWWISAMASRARRPGRNPYEQGWKSASRIGSSTSFRAACTTRSRTVGMPSRRLLPPGLGIIRSRTGKGANA